MKNAVIYARVSTADQVDNYSIQTQLEAMREYASEHDLEIVREYIEPGKSGDILERPTLTSMRQYLKEKQANAVIIHDLDRLSRKHVHQILLVNEFEENGLEVHFVLSPMGKTPEERMLFGMKGLFAEYERLKKMERSSRGRRARLSYGKLIGGASSRLYGYDYIPGKGNGKGVRKVNSNQARIVQDIFTWYAEKRLSLGGILNCLAYSGIKSPSGKQYWSKAELLKVLNCERYIGRTVIRLRATGEYIELPEATPRIINDELFNSAKVQLKRNKELARRNAKRQYLLSGYAYCKHDGRRYTGIRRKYGGKWHYFYRCGKTFESIPSLRCHNRTWRVDILDNLVWHEIESLLCNPGTVLAGIEAIKENASQESAFLRELELINKRLDELDREQEQLLQWALKGFPESTVIAENSRINNTRTELESRRDELQSQIDSARSSQVDIQNIELACELVKNNLGNLNLTDKRTALEALNIKVFIDGEELTISGSVPVSRPTIATTPSQPYLSHDHPPCP